MNKNSFEFFSNYLTAYINDGIKECTQELIEFHSPHYNTEGWVAIVARLQLLETMKDYFVPIVEGLSKNKWDGD